MTKKNIIITGGHSGIGLELTKRLIAEGHRVGLIVRNKERAASVKDISDVFVADMSDQEQLHDVAKTILATWESIDILFNNAGVLLDDIYKSKQENEMHYEVNTLAPYLLTTLLRPALGAGAVVVTTVTDGMHQTKSLDVEELVSPKTFRKLIGSYMLSKLAATLLMNDLATTWPDVRIVSVTPGPNKTGMTSGNGVPFWLKPFVGLLFAPPAKGAGLLYDAAFNANPATGVYFSGGRAHTLSLKLDEEQKKRILSGIKDCSK